MARRAANTPVSRRSFLVAVVTLLVLGLLPMRFQPPVEWLRELAFTVVTPVSAPFSIVSRWLSPATRADRDARIAALEDELELARALLSQSRQDAEQLRALLRQADIMLGTGATRPARHLVRAVVGSSSDLATSALTIRAGRTDGVTHATIPVTRGAQIVGRVVSVQTRTCVVRPITDRAADRVEGLILLDDDAAARPRAIPCTLEPTGDGALRGDAAFLTPTPAEPDPPRPAPGMTVRLSDPRWPATAQGFVLGAVEIVEPDPEQPLRSVVTVRPTVEVRRVSEVMLRVPHGDDPASDTGDQP